MLSNIKQFIKFFVYSLLNRLIFSDKKISSKSLLLIRLDAIGDYVLFRNFIEILKKSEQYKNYKITLLGNSAWKNLSEELDSDFLNTCIWLDKNKFNKNLIYRYRKLKEITSKGYEIVLSPTYSREFFYADTIVSLINASKKIGSIGDLSNIQKWQKKISDKYYTKLIPAQHELIFEFYRNREFFENFLDIKIEIKQPTIRLKPNNLLFELPEKYAILFIGASSKFRKWNMEKFAEVGKYLKLTYGYKIVLCGATSDNRNAITFKESFGDDFINLVGKTSLLELLYVIYNGNLMIANETSAPHFAVALGIQNIFVIYNGNYYGRFTPYPKEMAPNYHVIYHPKIEKDLDHYQKLSNSYGFAGDLNISEISVKSVIKKISEVLND